MKLLRAMTLWWALASFSVCAATNYFFRTVDVKDGLSDNFVRDVVRDSRGYLWFSTINGLSRYDGYRFVRYMPTEFGGCANDVSFVRETADSTLWMLNTGKLYTYVRQTATWQKDGAARLGRLGIEGSVKVFYVDDRHNLWVATDEEFFHYDYAQRRLYRLSNYSKSAVAHIVARNGTVLVVTTDYKIYKVALHERRLLPLTQAPAMPYSRDSRAFLDNSQNLWLYNSHSEAGMQWLFSLKTLQWRQLSELRQMGNVLVNAITDDNDGNLWVGTGNAGICLFAYRGAEGPGLGEMMRMNAFAPQSSHISCFYLDDNNTMWVGSAKLGAAFADMSCPTFRLVSTGGYEDVSSLVSDPRGNLWTGFDGGGVMVRSATGAVSHFSALRGQLPSDIITSLTVDAGGTVLAGTYGSGIARLEGFRFVPYHPGIPNLKYVKAMTPDMRGNLWVATVDRGVVKVRPDGAAVNYTSENSALESNGVLCLAVDSLHDRLYIGTSTGVSVYDCAKERFVRVRLLERLHGSYVSSLLVCSHNVLWIGSRDGLWVYRPKDGAMTRLTTEQGMSHNTVRALARSGSRIWASTDNGLTSVSVQSESSGRFVYKCYPFFDSDGLDNVVFSNNAAFTTADGTVLLGSFMGYVSIPPEDIVVRHPKLHVEFTDFRINGEAVSKSVADFRISYGERLGVSVSAMSPVLSRKVKYQYRFRGEQKWMRAPGNMLYFVSLTPGRHVLQVKAGLPGRAESDVAELSIRVMPPLWLSVPAVVLYLVLLAGGLVLLYRLVRRRQRRELAIKQMEMNLKKYEMEEEKIRFFTNIGHDLKTPLTLVVAPLEKIRGLSLPPAVRTELDVAWRNARQLYDLILQLLDFRRLDVGMETLNLRHGDLAGFVRQTVQEFSYYATRRQILVQLQLPPEPIETDFDENKLRRVVTNLLSNAVKYNVDNGTVTVSLAVHRGDGRHEVTLSVADTGIGVSDKRHIFGRFVQETHGQEQEGSGLGLHIVKQYVDMMGGSIAVTDNKPQGTVFTVTLPMTDTAGSVVEELSGEEPGAAAGGKQAVAGESPGRPLILVVDDNVDARLFLQRSLDGEFRVLVAANGQEALQQLARADDVSIVVSDMMMPVMDGIELFRRIKGDIRYSHIPVILLTAKSGEESIVAGLEEGVADYITKPFSMAVLRLRILKILEWSQQVHTSVASGIEIKPAEITVSSLDEELIAHAIADIEANLRDVNYSVVQLSSAVGMTRGHLYKKLMAITGKSPLEFIRIVKLKRGKSLLDQGKTNISEVADMVGFSPKQFGHYFKLTYGDTPSDYLKKRK